ncbi:MAG TPA: hypothetical protein VL128_16345 [Candidatus Eisenbacteria bacterium]|nr:hypothetical protein [Candidatus Eisenbacteria bacterium]
MASVQDQIKKTLAEVAQIHSLLYPVDDSDLKLKLFNARSRKEDAVRVTVLQMSLAIEHMLDGLFRKRFVGHNPHSKKRKNPKRGRARELNDLLESGRMGFEAKLKLARVLKVLTKKQQRRLEKLRALRNKCAHSWVLDVIHKKGRKPRPTKRLLEFEGKNLFDLRVLEDFVWEYSRIYLKLYGRYLS